VLHIGISDSMAASRLTDPHIDNLSCLRHRRKRGRLVTITGSGISVRREDVQLRHLASADDRTNGQPQCRPFGESVHERRDLTSPSFAAWFAPLSGLAPLRRWLG
jgi:hypothetical protein